VSIVRSVLAALRSRQPHAAAEPPAAADRSASPDGLGSRATLAELITAIPGLRDELTDRARSAGLLVGSLCLVVVPAWTAADRVLAPDQAGLFLLVRLLCDIPMLLAVLALWRLPVGRRYPERLTYLVLFIIQAEVGWMTLRTSDVSYYMLGFTVAIYVSGCVLVARPRWTVRLIGLSWLAVLVSGLTTPIPVSLGELVSIPVYLGTASLVAVLAHVRRFALSNQELLTRARLEHEQERTRGLLAQLERLSHEDPLTGLANRRRWDAELSVVCAAARETGEVVSLVLLDLDHFKQINDRHGHAAGDEALRAVAQLLRGRVRDGDLVARLGGDEIGVLLPGTDLERAAGLAEQVRREAALLAPARVSAGELTLSLGVATGSGARAYPLELMSCADAQLYCAKITRNAVGRATTESAHPGGPAGPRVVAPAR
jgi:diguanylate cyclase (GGDEF)-like protein